MQKRWLIHGIVAFTALIGGAHAVHAQGGGGGGGGGGTTSSNGLSTGAGVSSSGTATNGTLGTTTSGQAGAISSLTPSTSGNNTGNAGGNTYANTNSNSNNTVPATIDPFLQTYNNPLAFGTSGVSTSFSYTSSGEVSQITPTGSFGTPTWTAATVNYGSTTVKNSTGTNGEGFNTLSIPKTPPYLTVLSKNIPYVKHNSAKLQDTLLNTLANVPFLQGKKAIFLAVDGSTVFLKGEVDDEKKRRVVEGVVRMTPGVRNVVNELVAVSAKQ